MDSFIGIDVAKDFHVAAVVDASGSPVADTTFLNDAAGFALLAEWLASLGLNPDNSLVCMESTGHYHRLLLHRLKSDGWRVAVVNPVRTDAFRRVRSVRRTKTDLVDAYLIADFLRVERPEPVAVSPAGCPIFAALPGCVRSWSSTVPPSRTAWPLPSMFSSPSCRCTSGACGRRPAGRSWSCGPTLLSWL